MQEVSSGMLLSPIFKYITHLVEDVFDEANVPQAQPRVTTWLHTCVTHATETVQSKVTAAVVTMLSDTSK
jgi:hypothetical protein